MQEGISAERIAKLDYLESFGSIPIFSGRFVTAMRGVLSREVEFFECTIMCEGQSFQFFAAKLLKRLQLIEYEKSGVSEEKISSLPDIVLRTFEDSFLIAREKNPLRAYVLIVTDEFRTEAAKYQLQMDFSPTQHDL